MIIKDAMPTAEQLARIAELQAELAAEHSRLDSVGEDAERRAQEHLKRAETSGDPAVIAQAKEHRERIEAIRREAKHEAAEARAIAELDRKIFLTWLRS